MFANVNGFNESMDELIGLPDIELGVLKQLETIADQNKFSDVERVKAVLILKEPFSL